MCQCKLFQLTLKLTVMKMRFEMFKLICLHAAYTTQTNTHVNNYLEMKHYLCFRFCVNLDLTLPMNTTREYYKTTTKKLQNRSRKYNYSKTWQNNGFQHGFRIIEFSQPFWSVFRIDFSKNIKKMTKSIEKIQLF